jgi:hypothetical protein
MAVVVVVLEFLVVVVAQGNEQHSEDYAQGLAAVVIGSLSRWGDGYKLAVEALERGETFDILDYLPTYSYLPEVYYYQGRVREGLNSPGAGDSYRAYMSIRGTSSEDSLLLEVRHRLSKYDKH